MDTTSLRDELEQLGAQLFLVRCFPAIFKQWSAEELLAALNALITTHREVLLEMYADEIPVVRERVKNPDMTSSTYIVVRELLRSFS